MTNPTRWTLGTANPCVLLSLVVTVTGPHGIYVHRKSA